MIIKMGQEVNNYGLSNVLILQFWLFLCGYIYKDGAGGGKAESVKSDGGKKKKSWLAVELLIFALFSHLLLVISSFTSSSFI